MFRYDYATEMERNQEAINERIERYKAIDDMKVSKQEKERYKVQNLWHIESLKITRKEIMKYFCI